MTMSALSDLIARLEAAEAGSRELDAAIWKQVDEESWTAAADHLLDPGNRAHVRRQRSPAYTTSLDAALTLVPEDAGIQINRYWLKSRDAGVWSAHISRGIFGRKVWSEDAPSAALALCIAALKARTPASGMEAAEPARPAGAGLDPKGDSPTAEGGDAHHNKGGRR